MCRKRVELRRHRGAARTLFDSVCFEPRARQTVGSIRRAGGAVGSTVGSIRRAAVPETSKLPVLARSLNLTVDPTVRPAR
eukprot:1192483-Prorocentrum_minimum.AAC.1